MALADRLARRRLGPTGATPSGLALHAVLFVIGAFAFRPAVADGPASRALLVGIVVALLLFPPALLLDARRVTADTDWTPRRWLYLSLGLVPNPIGFLAVGDYLRKRRLALRSGGGELDETVADQLLRVFGPAVVVIFALGALADETAVTAAPTTFRYAAVAGVEVVFYLGYVRR